MKHTATAPFIRHLSRRTWAALDAPDWLLRPIEFGAWLAFFAVVLFWVLPRATACMFATGFRRGYARAVPCVPVPSRDRSAF